MKIGFHTVLWGRRIDDLDYMLDVIAACGYRGVELAQHHQQVFLRKQDGSGIRPLRDIDELLEHLRRRNLTLIGMVAGTLTERVKFLGDYKKAYLYLDRWPEKEVEEALKQGFTLAIHPHWLMPVRRLKQALDTIDHYKAGPYAKQVRLLLDTAHILIADDDPEKTVLRHFGKLAGVHLKNWKPDYGRWSHRYAHGFCPPEEGIVPVKDVMKALHFRSYDGWLIMEQDFFDIAREQTALHCAEWLHREGAQLGINIKPDAPAVRELQSQLRVHPFFEEFGKSGVEEYVIECINGKRSPESLFKAPFTAAALSGPLSELLLGRLLTRCVAHKPVPSDFYSIVSTTIRSLLGSQCVKVWSYNPLVGKCAEFYLLGIDAPEFPTSEGKTIITEEESLAGKVLSHPSVSQYDLREEKFASFVADKDWLEQLRNKAPWLLVLPVFNTSNPHQLRYLITSASREPLLKPTSFESYDMDASLERLGQLDAISWIMAYWADYLTDEICSAAAGHTNHLCGKNNQNVTAFVDVLVAYLEDTFQCNQVTLFLEDITGKRLEPIGSSRQKVDWNNNPPHYSIENRDALTWKAWQEREMVFSSKAIEGRARELRSPDDQRNEILFAPLVRRTGHCHGVVRLHNKRQPNLSVSSMFTDDDAAKLDAIIQTALPHLELLKMQEQQIQSLARMVHEFQAPLVAIRGAVDLMQTDLKEINRAPEDFFRRDYLDDVLKWTELMGRLTRNARIFAGGSETLRPRRTHLLSEVVMPVLRQIRPLVPDGMRFDSHQEELQTIPPLFIDRNQMQQVFFNLLSNSIKYHKATDLIKVRISGGRVGSSYTVFFEDWGTGIDESDREEIFQPGYRSQKAALSTTGQGLGLYVVRSIIEAHEGTILVRNCRNPTLFEINLPQRLRHGPPDTSQTSSI